MRSFNLACMVWVSLTVQSIAFELDRNYRDVFRLSGDFLIQDLAIGDRGRTNVFVGLCRMNRQLYVQGHASLAVRFPSVEVQLLPNGNASVVFIDGDGTQRDPTYEGVLSLFDTLECEDMNSFRPSSTGQRLYEVETVNGATNLTELLPETQQ